LFFTVQELPEIACIGDLLEFTLMTTPGNICYAGVAYMGIDGERSIVFEKLTADSHGLCSWVWEVDEKIPSGRASFSASVGDEITSNVMIPNFFTIDSCDQ
jgi:hypothetical protein